jgi:hypothetical protein
MWKAVLVGTTALAIAGSSLVYAQQRPERAGDGFRGRFNAEDMRAFGEARLAALKAGLALTPEQEKNWPAFEQAARDLGKLRLERITARREAARNGQARSRDPIERLRQRGTAMAQTGAALTKLADATDPLFKSLDDSQKRRFAVLGRMARGGGGSGRDMRGGDDWRGRLERGREDGGRGFERGREDRRDGSERGRRRSEQTDRAPRDDGRARRDAEERL